ncbi:hypothetical protein [Ferrimonas kyonanensis]|uniref:hypothetical protein n=1 Tax=Ferrimonas kyonanensis TaxID=364763 RepID=UPI0004269168|nr:hypothetical protein [Ferrimonas kyonanensis]
MKRLLIILLGCWCTLAQAQPGDHHGQIKVEQAQWQVWNQSLSRWDSVEAFWDHEAAALGSVRWPSSRDYPPYDQVQEHDTFLVQLDSGVCLMEFFHSRWRRANDVRRWDPAFNDYGACPRVFD